MKVDWDSKTNAYRALVDALMWFEEEIGHDGAPDGGDPHWVNAAIEAICRDDGLHYGPDFHPHWDAIVRSIEAEATAGRR